MGGSYHMEKNGLTRCVEFLEGQGITISRLITDRHRGIAKWIRENMKGTKHYYDVWHVAKCEKN